MNLKIQTFKTTISMKNYRKILLSLGFGTMILSSCEMDLVPKNVITTDDENNMFTSQLVVQNFGLGLHTEYRASFYGQASAPAELMLDGFNATANYGNNYGASHRMDNSFTAGDYDIEALWARHYGAMKQYNIFLTNIENYLANTTIAKTQANLAECELLKGYAYFYRANAYLELVRHFAKAFDPTTAGTDLAVPLVLVYDQHAKPARASVQAVYDQIKTDLDAAAERLADVAGKVRSMTPTIDAVNAAYARYYLDTKNYEKAAEYSNKIISSTKYKLADNISSFAEEYTHDAGTEAIMQCAGSLNENGAYTNNWYTLSGYYEGYKNYADGTGKYYDSYYLPSQKLIDLYTDGDLRFISWFKASQLSFAGDGRWNAYYTFTRYEGNPALTSNKNIPNSRHLVKPFLLPEFYLINAEANFKLGNIKAAESALNTLQGARDAELTEANIDEIGNEWFREMVGEGQRYHFLKRNHLGYQGRQGQRNAVETGDILSGKNYTERSMTADDIHWIFPIPAYEIKINNNLTQNTGY